MLIIDLGTLTIESELQPKDVSLEVRSILYLPFKFLHLYKEAVLHSAVALTKLTLINLFMNSVLFFFHLPIVCMSFIDSYIVNLSVKDPLRTGTERVIYNIEVEVSLLKSKCYLLPHAKFCYIKVSSMLDPCFICFLYFP